MTADLRARVAARLGGLLARLGELVDADPARELAPVPGDLHIGPIDAAPQGWPEGLPWPLTARQALEHLQAAQLDAVAWVESDIRAAVAWLVAPELVDDVLARPDLVNKWRWPRRTAPSGNAPEWCGPSYGWRLALGRLLRSWRADLPPADAGIWPKKDLSHGEVAEWARPLLNLRRPAELQWLGVNGLTLRDDGSLTDSDLAEWWRKRAELGIPTPADFPKEYPVKRALGDALVAEVESWGEIQQELWTLRADDLPVDLHRTTLALLCLVERQARESLPGEQLAAALTAVRAWASDGLDGVHNAAAKGALEVESGPADAVELLTRELLARELWRECPALVARLVGSAEPGELRRPPERGGLMALDAVLVDWLAERDQGEAEAVRAVAGERLEQWRAGALDAAGLFARWTDGRALRLVARVLWRVRVAAQWERQQKQHPAATSGVLDLLLAASYGAQWELPLVGVAPANLKDKRGRVLADFSAAGLDADTLTQMFRGRSLLATVAGTRLVRWELVTAHKQWLEMSGTGGDFRRTEVEGAWSGLAHLIGEHSKATVDALRDMVKAQAHGIFSLPGGRRGNLLGYDEPTRPAPGKPSSLVLYWQDPLLPAYVHSLPPGKAGESHRRARVLVPVVDSLPDLGATGYYAGAAAMLHWLVMLDLAQGAPELQRYGGVHLDWPKLWAQAGLSAEYGRKLLDRWTVDGDTAPAFLRDLGGRYALGPAHEKAQAFILARNELAAAKAKKLATRKRG
jgi:hypothetical protein